jgi:VWFA-related protein
MFARWPKTIAVCALASVFATATYAVPSDDEFTYRSTVEEVRLTLVATDRHNRFVENLSPTELAIVDNELIVRKFRSFTRSPEARLNVLVLIDSSASVGDRRKRETANALKLIRNASWGPTDNVTVLTFGAAPQLDCVNNCPSDSHPIAAAPVQGAGFTALYDYIVLSADLLKKTRTPDAKSILIVFSDGADNYSLHSLANAVDSLQQIDAIAYAVNLDPRRSSFSGTNALARLAASTGGLNLSIEDGVVPILEGVLHDLRSAYVLTYVPPVPSQGLHAVHIFPTRNLDLKFRSRQGYIYNRISEEVRASR